MSPKAAKPSSPVTPAPAGYSGTPLPKKLGIKPDSVLALIDAPDGFTQTLGELPPNVVTRTDLRTMPQMAVFFVRNLSGYARVLPRMASVLEAGGGTWVAWPKQTSKLASDVSETLIRERALAAGLVDIKVCAVDATWSGLRIARRRTPAR